MISAELSKPARIELILRQIDSLPTLPAVATRLLSLTASDDSHASEVIKVVEADPALTAKILGLCRSTDKRMCCDVMTIDKAVVLLGFNAIRNAVLSIKVFELFEEESAVADVRIPHTESQGPDDMMRLGHHFDRKAFWIHSLAVAILAEAIARGHPDDSELVADEAFVCGLLHDVGKLALDCVLPKSFARVVELTELNQANIGELERRVMGLDHHIAGKRVAEQWHLPHMIQDCIWLHGSAYHTLPQLKHRRMVGLITLADGIARRQHVGFSGNFTFKEDPRRLIEQLQLDGSVVDAAVQSLHGELEQRGQSIGLNTRPTQQLLLQSIQQANVALGRLNRSLETRGRTAATQGRILEAISEFHETAVPGRRVDDVLDAVVGSACTLLGPGFYGMIYPKAREQDDAATWLISVYSNDGRPMRSQYMDPPPATRALDQLADSSVAGNGVSLMGVLPWIADYLASAEDLRQVRLLPLSSGWGTVAILLHDREKLPSLPLLEALTSTWGAAIAAAAQHDGARRLGEQLAEANLALAEAQDRLLCQESMARLGEMAAGAAHEMNNPLAVISGRSQLLSRTLPAGSQQQKAANLVYREAHRLSDLITALHMFAEPPRPDSKPTDLPALLAAGIRQVKSQHEGRDQKLPIFLQIKQDLPLVFLDAEHIQRALFELLANAIQSNPKESVQVTAQVEPSGRAIVIQVIDDGDGMDHRTLDHAFDPFFSAKSAGRRVGMGLARADQLSKAHGGQIRLRSVLGKGTTASLILPLDSSGR